jgi:hypothetical protein
MAQGVEWAFEIPIRFIGVVVSLAVTLQVTYARSAYQGYNQDDMNGLTDILKRMARGKR